METALPLDGEAIAKALGLKSSQRKNGDIVLELMETGLDVRLVLAISAEHRLVRLFVDRGKRRLPSFVGSIFLQEVDEVTIGPTAKMVTFRAGSAGPSLSIWTNGRFRLI